MESELINNIKLFDNPETLEKVLREFSDIINNNSKSQVIRSVAAVQLKNGIYTRDEATSVISYKEKWTRVTYETRGYVKSNILSALEFDTNRPSDIADLIAHILCVEMSRCNNNADESASASEAMTKLIENLTKSEANAASGDVLLENTCEALYLICRDVVDTNHLSPFLDRLLELVELYVRDRSNTLSASESIKASILSILTASDSFMSYLVLKKKKELDSIIEATLDENQTSDFIKLAGLKCLETYITSSACVFLINDQTLKLTLELAKSENKELAVQATHFWIHVLKIQIKIGGGEEGGNTIANNILSDETLFDLSRIIRESLLPALFRNLCQQTESEEDDEMTVFKSASICLLLCTQYLQDEMISPLAEFMNEHLDLDKSWQELDASLICLGASLKQARHLERIKGEILEQKLDILRGMLASAHLDSNVFATNEACRDTCESLIYLICKILPEYMNRFEHVVSEFRVRSFKFFLFNKNLLLDWTDNFKTISFNRSKLYRVNNLQEGQEVNKNNKFGSDVVSIASSVIPDAKVDRTNILISPPKQPMININELQSALKHLKKLRNNSNETGDLVVDEESSNKSLNRQETMRNDVNDDHDDDTNGPEDTATPTNEPELGDEGEAFEETAEEQPGATNNLNSDKLQAEEVREELAEVQIKPEPSEVITSKPSKASIEKTEILRQQKDVEQEEDPVEKLHRMYKQQKSPEAREVPAFLLVKLKHVKPPLD